MRRFLLLIGLVANTLFGFTCEFQALRAQTDRAITRGPLDSVDRNHEPWRDLDAEQSYVYIGATPREMALGLPLSANPKIPLRLKARAERELSRIRQQLKLPEAEFEIWPTYDDWNSLTWMVARYRESPRHVWKWLDQTYVNPNQRDYAGSRTGIVLPDFLDPAKPQDQDQIFNHFPADLYQRPVFENVVWMTADRKQVLAAWLKYGAPTGPGTADRPAPGVNEVKMQRLCQTQACAAANINPPARLNDQPITFIARSDAHGVRLPENIEWVPEIRTRPRPPEEQLEIAKWPGDMQGLLTRYVARLSGVEKIISPVTGREIDFKKQSSGQRDNQLWDTANYLVQIGESLGYLPVANHHLGYRPSRVAGAREPFTMRIERFDWDGIPQTNVIATIRGRKHGPKQKIVIASAHFDKAIAEDTYQRSQGRLRETTPGADDNASGVAALFLAMETLREHYASSPPEYDIEFVFDTGEEFPAGTAGARKYVSEDLLNKQRDVAVNLNLDMIGKRTRGDRIWQISPGATEGSWARAEQMLGVANALNAQLRPQSRWEAQVLYPWSLHRQIDQTSGGIWDWAGYDTVTINEHLNLQHRWNSSYHQSQDVKIDAKYAEFQVKVLIECLARAAEGR